MGIRSNSLLMMS